MTQALLRRHTAFYAGVLVCINLFMCLYLSSGTQQNIQYEFNKEMLARVSYLSSMAEWVPVDQLLTSTAINAISSSVPFHIKIVPSVDTPHNATLMRLSSGFPLTATKYSPVLKAYVELTEGEMTKPSTGSQEEFLSTALCFTAMLPLTLFSFLAAANLLAAQQRRVLAAVIIWIGYLGVPCALAVGMLTLFSRIQLLSEINAWSEDVHRSASLYSSMFAAVYTLLSIKNTEMLSQTMELVNTALYSEVGLYQVSVAVGESRELNPRLCSATVERTIFENADHHYVTYQGYTSGYFYAASPISVLASLIVVLRQEGKPPTIINTEYLPALITMLGAIVLSGLLLLVFVFPYYSLGRKGLLFANENPWDSRLCQFWPYAKMLEGGVAVCVCVVVCLMALTRIARHYHRIAVLKDYYVDQANVIRDVQTVSNSLGQCYTGVLGTEEWNVDFAQYTTMVLTVDDYLSLAQFYRRLARTISELQYYAHSLSDYLNEQPEERWPIMSNMLMPYMSTTPQNEAGLLFQHWVIRYDCEFLLSVLTNNMLFLLFGDPGLFFSLQSSLSPEIPVTVLELLNAMETTFTAQGPYYNRAFAYTQQEVNLTTFVEFYQSDLGKLVTTIEKDVAFTEKSRVPPCRYFDLSYPWISFTSFYICYVCVAVALGLWVFDLLYSAKFFIGAEWSWLRWTATGVGREGSVVRIETYDYTAAKSTMPANMHGIRRNFRRLVGSFGALVGLTLLFGVVIQVQSLRSVSELSTEAQYYQHTVVPLSKRVQQGAMIEMGLAAWGRAYLSLEDTHVCMAIEMTNAWSTMKPVVWVGGSAVADPRKMRSKTMQLLFETVRNVSIQTALLRQERSVEKVYEDFETHLQEFDDVLYFNGYETCFDQLSYFYSSCVKEYLLCLISNLDDGCSLATIAPLTGVSQMCTGRGLPSNYAAFLYRSTALRLRSGMMVNHQTVSQLLNAVTDTTNKEVLQMLNVFLGETDDIQTITTVPVPWLVLSYAWICCGVLFLIFIFSRQFFFSIYYN